MPHFSGLPNAIVVACSEVQAAAQELAAWSFDARALIPADDPREIWLEGEGVAAGISLHLVRRDEAGGETVVLELEGVAAPRSMEFCELEIRGVAAGVSEDFGPPSFEFIPAPQGEEDSIVGRAGMRYRDLLPGRQGGAVIASLIQIPGEGPVPDRVHYHQVLFQMIYCRRGWVELLYEDQGEAFVMRAGDCVLQPPEIRHRVLRSGEDLEVVEVGLPAEHPTLFEPLGRRGMELPNGVGESQRRWSGQGFCLHRSDGAEWVAEGDWESLDLEIEAATDGLARVRRRRLVAGASAAAPAHRGGLSFAFVLSGAGTLETHGASHPLGEGASFALQSDHNATLRGGGKGLELLWVEVR